ncbi:MAG: hypothetical protein GYA17_12915 [Chloroflexi bacterium]|nr:hypothetical protein [Anaerolineaceae bacterium]NMB89254.1 hypothetical protein [Chloroflexota bacterium]
MFETLMVEGGYRIDYVNIQAQGRPGALAFYVRGDLDGKLPYSLRAKRHLQAGLSVIQRSLDLQKLVAVYMDVNSSVDLARPAYNQLKTDLRAGLFRRVFVFATSDLVDGPLVEDDMRHLYAELGGFEVLVRVQDFERVESVVSHSLWRLALDKKVQQCHMQ